MRHNLRQYLRPLKPRWLFRTRSIDGPEFLSTWEKRWQYIADPSNQEVYERLNQLGAINVAEIGAGYGRVSNFLAAKGLSVYPIEPNNFLIMNFNSRSDLYTGKLAPVIIATADQIPLLPVDYYFSVRALEYCNFFELIQMAKKLRKYDKPLVTWERRAGSARIRIAAWITLNNKIYIQTLVR